MKNILVLIRNKIIGTIYKFILKPILFLFDPEKIHDVFIKVGRLLGSNIITKGLTTFLFGYSNKALNQTFLGIDFKNPVGLAAGFDKDGLITNIIPYVGFGFEEMGSITGESCEGNPKPRLWRLPKSKGLVVYYGLKNQGCEKISARLQKKKFKIPLGISVAKTNCEITIGQEEGIKDYIKAFNHIKDLASYITINISCPNAYGGQPFTNPEYLNNLLAEIEKNKTDKPIFLKLPPDISKDEIDKILDISRNHNISGFICTNLTKDRGNEKIHKKVFEKNIPDVGGISGKPIEDLSNESIKYIYEKTKDRYVIIGCGGIFSAEDAYKKIKLGASLVQLITGMIFEGPQLISEINRGLVKLLKKDGFKNISEAIGIDNK